MRSSYIPWWSPRLANRPSLGVGLFLLFGAISGVIGSLRVTDDNDSPVIYVRDFVESI